jgi:hypothetical protein
MKVTITITVDIDEQAREDWDLNFGTGTGADAIRRDVKTYFGNMAQQGAEVIAPENITWR